MAICGLLAGCLCNFRKVTELAKPSVVVDIGTAAVQHRLSNRPVALQAATQAGPLDPGTRGPSGLTPFRQSQDPRALTEAEKMVGVSLVRHSSGPFWPAFTAPCCRARVCRA